MEYRARSGVKPITDALEWRPLTGHQAHDVAIEIAQFFELGPRNAQVVVAETVGGHRWA